MIWSRRPLVTVLRLAGVIGGRGRLGRGLDLAGLNRRIEAAFRPRRLAAVALCVNSPGGSAAQANLIARRIRDAARVRDVPVLAFAEDVAASGGYWLACSADEIFADPNSLVGSIGVVTATFGAQDLLARIGVERRLFTAGDRKSLLDPFLEQKPEDVARLKALQKELHESFKTCVRDRRGRRLPEDETEIFSGEFWTGRRALELGLIDGLGEMHAVLRERFGERVRIKEITDRVPFWRRGFTLPDPGVMGFDALGGAVDALEERLWWGRYGL